MPPRNSWIGTILNSVTSILFFIILGFYSVLYMGDDLYFYQSFLVYFLMVAELTIFVLNIISNSRISKTKVDTVSDFQIQIFSIVCGNWIGGLLASTSFIKNEKEIRDNHRNGYFMNVSYSSVALSIFLIGSLFWAIVFNLPFFAFFILNGFDFIFTAMIVWSVKSIKGLWSNEGMEYLSIWTGILGYKIFKENSKQISDAKSDEAADMKAVRNITSHGHLWMSISAILIPIVIPLFNFATFAIYEYAIEAANQELNPSVPFSFSYYDSFTYLYWPLATFAFVQMGVVLYGLIRVNNDLKDGNKINVVRVSMLVYMNGSIKGHVLLKRLRMLEKSGLASTQLIKIKNKSAIASLSILATFLAIFITYQYAYEILLINNLDYQSFETGQNHVFYIKRAHYIPSFIYVAILISTTWSIVNSLMIKY